MKCENRNDSGTVKIGEEEYTTCPCTEKLPELISTYFVSYNSVDQFGRLGFGRNVMDTNIDEINSFEIIQEIEERIKTSQDPPLENVNLMSFQKLTKQAQKND